MRRADRIGIFLRHIIREGAHQLRAAGPHRIWVLPLNLVEQLGRVLIVTLVEPVLGQAVKCVDVARDISGIALDLVVGATGHGEQDDWQQQQGRDTGFVHHGDFPSAGFR